MTGENSGPLTSSDPSPIVPVPSTEPLAEPTGPSTPTDSPESSSAPSSSPESGTETSSLEPSSCVPSDPCVVSLDPVHLEFFAVALGLVLLLLTAVLAAQLRRP